MGTREKTSLAVVAALLIASADRTMPVAIEMHQGQRLDVEARVKRIIVEHLGVKPDKVIPAARLIEDLGADSLDVVELIMAFEEEFGIEYPDAAAEKMLTVGDAVKFIRTQVTKPKG